MKKQEKRVYISPAIEVFALEVKNTLGSTSFHGSHLPGETADDGIDQGGGHGIGDVEEDEGD
ncbi:hypothetical protein [Segatella salivae]|uniref:Uncharacterized protein n=1 Tax=Segatella salivae F0493 TaxID=1395125 RepID=U2KNP7_9BACT|nr:hypothetical protein [Segatella salivae]ERK00112.1 hypothetical protein HMPREF9145_2684 [Segatella salivae F0493]